MGQYIANADNPASVIGVLSDVAAHQAAPGEATLAFGIMALYKQLQQLNATMLRIEASVGQRGTT